MLNGEQSTYVSQLSEVATSLRRVRHVTTPSPVEIRILDRVRKQTPGAVDPHNNFPDRGQDNAGAGRWVRISVVSKSYVFATTATINGCTF